jgi:hypothetical protein
MRLVSLGRSDVPEPDEEPSLNPMTQRPNLIPLAAGCSVSLIRGSCPVFLLSSRVEEDATDGKLIEGYGEEHE